MEANMMFFLLIVSMVPVFIAMMFIPYLTRRTESFGVSIPEHVYYLPEIKGMRKQYAMVTGIIGLLSVAIITLVNIFYGNNPNTVSIIWSILILLYIVSSFLVYLNYHRKMKARKALEKWNEKKPQHVIIDTSFREQKLNHSNGWFIISFIIAFGTMFLSFWFYDRIPDKIPMQYDFSGKITNWADKSYRTVMLMPIMQVYLTLLFLFINTLIAKAKQQLSAENPEKSIRQNIIFRRRWSAFIIITGTALNLLFLLIQYSIIFPINSLVLTIVPLLFAIGVTAGSIVLSFTTGQGGSRIKVSSGKKGDMTDRDDDQYWKLGQFYFNRNDPALFLEKRFGVGWTINFAQPLAWMIFLLIILLAVGLPAILS